MKILKDKILEEARENVLSHTKGPYYQLTFHQQQYRPEGSVMTSLRFWKSSSGNNKNLTGPPKILYLAQQSFEDEGK